jgi:hypothetical protein
MSLTHVLWGAVFGWLLAPRITGPKKIVISKVSAYFLALTAAFAMTQYLQFQRQVLWFLIGMAGQSSMLCLFRVFRRMLTRVK